MKRFRTGVRLPPPPPNVRYTNTVSRGKFTVVRNVFVIVVNLDDYDDDAHRQTKRATYKEIHDWIKQNHGIHVSNHDISQAKMLCGLSKALHKGSQGAEEHDVPDLKPEKEAIIREAFKWFGII